MNPGRIQPTATLLNNGMVLVTGGSTIINGVTTILASAELYDPVTGVFTPTGSMAASRVSHTATLLKNGMVLVAGGGLATAELYDPSTGIFTVTGNMTTVRGEHTATLLNNGKVLVAGGIGDPGGTNLATAELYDPTTGTFTATGSMTGARFGQTATLLKNGMVLVAGGSFFPFRGVLYLDTSEVYDPTTGIFAVTGNMTIPRAADTATLLNNGEVLVAGGVTNSTLPDLLNTAELYDPANGTFTLTGTMISAHAGHTATFLNNGMVLIAGGDTPTGLASGAELYDSSTGAFTLTGNLSIPRDSHTATLLNNGMVLLAGGFDPYAQNPIVSAELYEPTFVLPASLAFTNQVQGTTSAPQNVTFTNYQSTAVSITSIVITGANASDFAESGNCGTSVAVGVTCTINVTFTPGATGARNASLLITDNATGSPQTVALTGTGIGSIAVSPNSLSFTNQIQGTTSPSQSVTVTNYQATAVTISSIVITGTNGADFAETNNCGASIGVNGTCMIGVTFTPGALGARNASLVISYSGIASPQSVPLGGTGISSGISVSPTTINFQSQYVGASSLPQTVTLTNNGATALSITSVATSAADFGQLSACGSSLAAGSSCAIGVFFDPTLGGTRTGTLTITDNAPGGPQTVALSGTGQDFSMTPTPQASTVTAGQTASYQIAINPAGGFN